MALLILFYYDETYLIKSCFCFQHHWFILIGFRLILNLFSLGCTLLEYLYNNDVNYIFLDYMLTMSGERGSEVFFINFVYTH